MHGVGAGPQPSPELGNLKVHTAFHSVVRLEHSLPGCLE